MTGATDSSEYTISGAGAGSLVVSGVVKQSSTTYTLNLFGTISVGSIVLSVGDGIVDASGQSVDSADQSVTFNGDPFSGDTTGPQVADIFSPDPNQNYITGQTVTIDIVFDEPIIVSGTPELTLNTGATISGATNLGSALRFAYVIAGGENTGLLEVTGLTVLSGGISDSAANVAPLVYPVVAQVQPYKTTIRLV